MLSNAGTLTGYKLDSLDGEIGKVKEFYFDDRQWTIRYLVADTGNWLSGGLSPEKHGMNYRYARTITGTDTPTATATFTPDLPAAGEYHVDVWYSRGDKRSAKAKYQIVYQDASIELDGDPRLRLLPSLGIFAFRGRGAPDALSWGYGIDPSLGFRLSRSVTGVLAPHFDHNSDNNQWVDNIISSDQTDTAYTFGHLDQNTVSLTARLIWSSRVMSIWSGNARRPTRPSASNMFSASESCENSSASW